MGPTVISAAEQAIVADPDAGIEHAVILVDETVWDGEEVKRTRVVHHRDLRRVFAAVKSMSSVALLQPVTEPAEERSR